MCIKQGGRFLGLTSSRTDTGDAAEIRNHHSDLTLLRSMSNPDKGKEEHYSGAKGLRLGDFSLG